MTAATAAPLDADVTEPPAIDLTACDGARDWAGRSRGWYSAHVRPAPVLEPPYDPLDQPGRPELRLVDASTPPDEPLPFEPPRRCTSLGDDFWGPQPTQRHALPDPRGLATAYVQAAMETLAGRRAPAQLQRWTSPALFQDLMQGRRRPRSGRTVAPVVTTVRVSEPADGVAEIAAVVRRGSRFHAVAARLEGVDGRWQCVTLQIG